MTAQLINFYDFHYDFLINQSGGHLNPFGGSWYPLQKHGLCSYTAVQAWINSYLTETQIKRLEFIKAQLSTEKQKRLIEILGSNMSKVVRGKTNKNKKFGPYSEFVPNSQRLKTNRLLLDLGQAYLKQLGEELYPSLLK